MRNYMLAAGLFALAASPAFASSVCPVLNGGYTGGGGGLSSTYTADSGVTNGGCNVLITFAANGSISTTYPNAASSYDSGGDDTMVGIINDTGSAISSIALSSADDIFGFDGDGACEYTVGGHSPCGSSPNSSGYAPSSVTDTGVNAYDTAGTVNFAGGIGAGDSAWFSLEDPVSLTLTVNPTVTPEPGGLILLGTGILGLAGVVRRKLAV
ncbi:MAG: PEP-CTERM sorting domain-containing protein [Acidobacteriaceae bacterium]